MLRDPLLIFDLGNVILKHDDAVLFDGLSAACRDPATARARLARIFERGGADLQSTEAFFESFKDEIGFEGGFDRFEPIWCSHFSRDPLMEDLVRNLAARYQLVILSNTNDSHWRFLTGAYDILQVPRALYTSFELGMEKPSLEIYQHVLDAEHRESADSIFIDDRIGNVEAARRLGINGIHFTDRPKLERELAALGVVATERQ